MLALLSLLVMAIATLARRGRSQQPPPTYPRVFAPAPIPIVPIRSGSHHFQRDLVLRAVRGLALALLLVVSAWLPWPTAWVVSAAIAPEVAWTQAQLRAHVDLLTIGLVSFALLEPLLRWLLQQVGTGALLAPHLLWLLGRLALLHIRIGVWRFRTWRLQQAMRRHTRTSASATRWSSPRHQRW